MVYFFLEILPPMRVLGICLSLTYRKELSLEERKNNKEENSKGHMGSGNHHGFFSVKREKNFKTWGKLTKIKS